MEGYQQVWMIRVQWQVPCSDTHVCSNLDLETLLRCPEWTHALLSRMAHATEHLRFKDANMTLKSVITGKHYKILLRNKTVGSTVKGHWTPYLYISCPFHSPRAIESSLKIKSTSDIRWVFTRSMACGFPGHTSSPKEILSLGQVHMALMVQEILMEKTEKGQRPKSVKDASRAGRTCINIWRVDAYHSFQDLLPTQDSHRFTSSSFTVVLRMVTCFWTVCRHGMSCSETP